MILYKENGSCWCCICFNMVVSCLPFEWTTIFSDTCRLIAVWDWIKQKVIQTHNPTHTHTKALTSIKNKHSLQHLFKLILLGENGLQCRSICKKNNSIVNFSFDYRLNTKKQNALIKSNKKYLKFGNALHSKTTQI